MLALASLTFNLSSRYNMSNHQVLFIGYYSAVSLPDTLFSVLSVFLVPTEKEYTLGFNLFFNSYALPKNPV